MFEDNEYAQKVKAQFGGLTDVENKIQRMLGKKDEQQE